MPRVGARQRLEPARGGTQSACCTATSDANLSHIAPLTRRYPGDSVAQNRAGIGLSGKDVRLEIYLYTRLCLPRLRRIWRRIGAGCDPQSLWRARTSMGVTGIRLLGFERGHRTRSA